MDADMTAEQLPPPYYSRMEEKEEVVEAVVGVGVGVVNTATEDDTLSQWSNSSSCSGSSFSSSLSMLSVTSSHTIPEMSLDLAWGVVSDSMFLVGGLCYVILSLWDIYKLEDDDNENDYDDMGVITWRQRWYGIIENAGPIVYLLNSIIDVRWATDTQRLEKQRRRQQRQEERQRERQQQQQQRQQQQRQQQQTTMRDHDHNGGDVVQNKHGRSKKLHVQIKKQLHRVRKYAAHRRGLFAALTFGIAAMFGLLDELLWDTGPHNYERSLIRGSDRGWLDFLSVHFYLVSAIFALTGQRTKPRRCTRMFFHDPDQLEDLGDYLFLIGSSLDVILCDFHFDDRYGLWWAAVSSFLWFFDACLYLRSDYCTGMVLRRLLQQDSYGIDIISVSEGGGVLPMSLLGSYIEMGTMA
jgi:hypothetical protein